MLITLVVDMQSLNSGPWLAFNKQWFETHQAKLLWLLKFKLFRYFLRIDCDQEIVEILPNCYTIQGKRNEYITDFRTHPKYSKRVYYAFRPLWWLFHVWDLLVADKFIPQWSFGFATLTAYPDADPETTTVDGFIYRELAGGAGEAWATFIAGVGTTANSTSDVSGPGFNIQADNVSAKWIHLRRGICLFDTSSLTTAATISAATLSLYVVAKSDALSITPNIDIYTSTPATNTALVTGDFSQVGSTSQTGAATGYSSITASAYNDFAFNATGISNISQTSISKFGVRNANYDVAASAPTWTSLAVSDIRPAAADTAGTTNDPKLVVTYAVSNRINIKSPLKPRPFSPGLAR